MRIFEVLEGSQKKTPIDEECSFHPASPYAISKVGTDLIEDTMQKWTECTNNKNVSHTGPRRGDVFAESTFAKQIALAEKVL